MGVKDSYYKNIRERIQAISDALNEELTEVARAGCAARDHAATRRAALHHPQRRQHAAGDPARAVGRDQG